MMCSDEEKVVCGPKIKDIFRDQCAGEIFFHVLKNTSGDDSVLVDVSNGVELKRSELLESTVKLATFFKNQGLASGDIIGVISPNSWKFVTSIIAISYLGCTLTVSNPNYLKDDLDHFLSVTHPKMLLITSQVYHILKDLLPKYPEIKAVVMMNSGKHEDTILFDDILMENVDVSSFEPTKVDPKSTLHYILFSSGTTGMPKGVMHTQEGIKHTLHILGHPRANGLNDSHTLLVILPLFHIFGLAMVLGALVKNAKVILLEKFRPNIFLDTIEKYKVTYLPVVPTVLLFMAKSDMVDKKKLTSLRDIICGGAPVGRETELLIAKKLNNVIPRQIYGITESGGGVIAMPPDDRRPGSVGKVVAGFEVKVVDPKTRTSLGPNEAGEICVRGTSVMKGYYNNEEATKKDMDEDGFLRSGDLGYYDEDEYFYILERIKEVIKYKGFQVPPAQLENILIQHPAVKEVAVIGKPDERAGELPTAFIVKQEGVSITEQELVQLVAKHMHTDKQLHGGVVFVDEIPKTQSGKIARSQLRRLLG